jgi:uncharacterized NAD(P)/FAD-binding protein YdhS
MIRVEHVAIVGGGFSGTLLAINLLRHGALRVTLVERRPDRLAKGLAFGSARAEHVLNVRAGNMSAFPDQPGHFADWLKQRDTGGDGTFATRQAYGAYLQSLLETIRREAGERLVVITDQAVDLDVSANGCHLTLKSGRSLSADIVVLAPGNLAPHDPPPFRGCLPPQYVRTPWSTDIGAGLADDDTVLLLGSGLTAVDCMQMLDTGGFRGRILALSRRGLMPHRHAPARPFTGRTDRPASVCTHLVRAVRERAAEIGWRNAVDEIRPFTQDIWRAAPHEERARFLRHLRPYWDVHRHRIAPQVAERLDRMTQEGRLEVRAGKIVEAARAGDGLQVTWRPRGGEQQQRLRVARAINCTGPLSDLSQTTDPLLRRLADRGLIRPDVHAIGIDVDRQGCVIAQDGTPQRRIRLVGPMTRGAHWEIVAVPDIRRQAWDLARAITGAHWVEAEGL